MDEATLVAEHTVATDEDVVCDCLAEHFNSQNVLDKENQRHLFTSRSLRGEERSQEHTKADRDQKDNNEMTIEMKSLLGLIGNRTNLNDLLSLAVQVWVDESDIVITRDDIAKGGQALFHALDFHGIREGVSEVLKLLVRRGARHE